MSTIEGGMVCTSDDDFAEMLRIVRANGWDRNLNPEQQQKWRTQFGIETEFEAKIHFLRSWIQFQTYRNYWLF